MPKRPVVGLAEYRVKFSKYPPIILPLGLEEDLATKTPDALAREAVSVLRGMCRNAETRLSYREGRMALAVLHEAVEAGLVDRYLGGADLRWLCEGVSNYMAWKIARDRAGEAFAREVYDLDRQLANAVGWQRQIDLRRWAVVENQSQAEQEAPLSAAHYAFATRAVFELVRQNGEDFLPKLFQEVAKTPREKTSMKTVEKAYRKITGKRLGDVIKVAERTPLAAGGG